MNCSTSETASRDAFRLGLAQLFAALLILAMAQLALANDPTVLKGKMLTEIDALGNANTTITFTPNIQLYTALKSETPNTAVLVKQLGLTSGWGQLDDLKGNFNDGANTIEISYRQRGVCREIAEGRWAMEHITWQAGQVVATYGNQIVINQVMPSELGFASMVCIVKCPEQAEDLKLTDNRNQLTFDYVPQIEGNAGSPSLDVRVQTKENLLSSLAKCYSNSDFGDMWTARSVVENVGDAPLDDFRIRFRVADMSAWSSWNRVHRVYPGQSVVDPFFPVFDLQKLAELNSSRTVMIEVEYSYRDQEGRQVKDSDSFPVNLMARNEAVFSSLPPEECLSFEDHFNNIAPLLASMTTPSDPVVQQLVGRIHGAATERLGQGIAVAMSDEDAIEYLRSIHHFMTSSGIAYQTPPSLLVDGQAGQHIKYSRDVLSNRAGTCVDLTVLWMSLVQSAGLDPIGVVIPGHAFPAVRLPGGDVIAIESTMLQGTFEEAVQVGMKNLNEVSESILVDVAQLHAAGVTPLDLPQLPVDFLEQMNYDFEPPVQTMETPAQEDEVRKEEPPVKREVAPPVDPSGLAGTWSFSGMHGEVYAVFVLRLQADGQASVHIELTNPEGEQNSWAGSGTWQRDGEVLVMQINEETIRWPYRLNDGGLDLELPELKAVFNLSPLTLN